MEADTTGVDPSLNRVLESDDVSSTVTVPTSNRGGSSVANEDRNNLALVVPPPRTLTTHSGAVSASSSSSASTSTTTTSSTTVLSTSSTTTTSKGKFEWGAESYVRPTSSTNNTGTPQIKYPPPQALLMDRTPPPKQQLLMNHAEDDKKTGVLSKKRAEASSTDDTLLLFNDAGAAADGSFQEADSLREPLLLNDLNLGSGSGSRGRRRGGGRQSNDNDESDEAVWRNMNASSSAHMAIVVLVAIGIAMLIVALDWNHTCTSSPSDSSDSSSDKKDWYPAVVRYQHVLECAEKAANVAASGSLVSLQHQQLRSLSSSLSLKESSWTPTALEQEAIDWFLTGPGREVTINDTKSTTSHNTSTDADDYGCHVDFAPLYALLVLRNAVNVPDKSWYNTDHAIRTVGDICSPSANHWRSLDCSTPYLDENGRSVIDITKLSLENSNLTGVFPVEMAYGLAQLTSLDAFDNVGLVGTLPEFLSQLTRLQNVRLHETGLAGTIPSSWGRLTALQTLLLDNTSITGSVPDEVCQLTLPGGTGQLTTLQVPPSVQCSCCGSTVE